MASENETVEAAIDAVRKMIHDCPAIKGGFGEFGYQLKANGAIDRIEAAHRREVAELRECLNRRSKHINTILQKALELGKSVPLELREVMDDCIVAEDKAIGLGVFSKKVRRREVMNFIELNKNIRELENGCWRQTAFEDLQVQYCEERLYALRCKRGTPNEHICLIREQSEDAAIARAVFDLHKRGEIDANVKALRAKLKVAEDALAKLQDRFVSSVHDGTIDPYAALKIAEDALAAIREKGATK